MFQPISQQVKVLITAAGLGTRSGLNGHIRKEMLPVYDCRSGKLLLRPIIDVIINRYRSYGFSDFVVVLSRNDRRSRLYIEEFSENTEIVIQESPRGFGDAVLTASELISGKFILNCGDGILISRKDTDSFIEKVRSGRHSIVLGLMETDNPSRYGIATVQGKGSDISVTGVVEKPSVPPSNLAMVAVYQLTELIFDELRKSTKENVELTPAINSLIKSGESATAFMIERENWLSVGHVEDYMKVLRSSYDHSLPCE